VPARKLHASLHRLHSVSEKTALAALRRTAKEGRLTPTSKISARAGALKLRTVDNSALVASLHRLHAFNEAAVSPTAD
jgi:hypothetical protein